MTTQQLRIMWREQRDCAKCHVDIEIPLSRFRRLIKSNWLNVRAHGIRLIECNQCLCVRVCDCECTCNLLLLLVAAR